MTREEKNARRRARYAENADHKDRVREQNAMWRVKNPQRAKECDKKSYDKRKDSIAEYKRGYYKANAEQEKARAAEWYEANKDRRKDRQAQMQKWVYQLKADAGCKVCGLKDPVCLEFHHRDPAEKSFEVGSYETRSYASMEKEIAKCDVLCRNCHSRATKEQKRGLGTP